VRLPLLGLLALKHASCFGSPVIDLPKYNLRPERSALEGFGSGKGSYGYSTNSVEQAAGMAAELAKLGHPMLAALLTVGLSAPVQAETPPEAPQAAQEAPLAEELELIKEEESVSIASRYEQPISQAPSEVFVITDEDIRHSGAIDIPTLLRRIPGMEVMQMNGADFNVSVRGDNQPGANKLLVMVDGRSIYIDVQGAMFWKLLPVTLPEIKRIEVLKGPASAVWGFNAFDGVINIITKSPEEMRGTTLQFGGGNFGTVTASAIQAGTYNKFGYRLSIGHNQNADWTNRNALAFRDNLFNVLTEYALSPESKIKVAGGLVDSNAFNSILAQDVIDPTRPAQAYASVGYERPNFFVRAFWNQYTDTSNPVFLPPLAPFLTLGAKDGSPTQTFNANTYNIDVQHSLELLPRNRLTYGANYRYNTLSSNGISQYSTENRLGFFFQDEWNVAKPITLIAGLRYDLDTFINPTLSPRVALLYTPSPDHTFRLSGSVAYRPPTLLEKNSANQVTTNPPLPPETTVIVGGQSLSPEQIVSYDLGYQGWYAKHRLRLRLDAFFNHISDLISARNQSPTVATYVNDPGSADIYGAEAGIEFLATKWLTGFANYSYQDIRQSFTGRVQRGGPHNKFNVGMRGEWDNGLSAEAIYHYYGSAIYPPGQSFSSFAQAGLVTLPDPQVGAYNLLNMRGAYKFWRQKASAGYLREAEVAISVFNALDDRAREYPTGEQIGRRIMGWLTVRF
jgi:outer membrane receptor for ferrienterochelin and colicin